MCVTPREGGAFKVESLLVFANQGRGEPHHQYITTTLPRDNFDEVPVDEADAHRTNEARKQRPRNRGDIRRVLPGADDGAT
jgi:hypothetical protein